MLQNRPDNKKDTPSTTLILAPLALLEQWAQEIEDKTEAETFSVLIYVSCVLLVIVRNLTFLSARIQQAKESQRIHALRCCFDYIADHGSKSSASLASTTLTQRQRWNGNPTMISPGKLQNVRFDQLWERSVCSLCVTTGKDKKKGIEWGSDEEASWEPEKKDGPCKHFHSSTVSRLTPLQWSASSTIASLSTKRTTSVTRILESLVPSLVSRQTTDGVSVRCHPAFYDACLFDDNRWYSYCQQHC